MAFFIWIKIWDRSDGSIPPDKDDDDDTPGYPEYPEYPEELGDEKLEGYEYILQKKSTFNFNFKK